MLCGGVEEEEVVLMLLLVPNLSITAPDSLSLFFLSFFLLCQKVCLTGPGAVGRLLSGDLLYIRDEVS